MEFFVTRQGWLEAAVFSGGEPTAHPALADAMSEIKAAGFKIGLHSSGVYPENFAAVLPLADWVGLDIKAPLDARYDRIAGARGAAEKTRESLKLLLASGVPHQLRTTVHPKLLSSGDLADLQRDLAACKAGPSILQPFRPQGCLDEELVATGDRQLLSS